MTVPDAAIVDASVAIKWVVDEPDTEIALRPRGARLHAPDLIFAECANILWKKAARGQLSPDAADFAARALEGADIEVVATRPLVARATALSIRLGHPAYDCLYLLAAADLALPLVTADARLHRLSRGPGPSRAGLKAATILLADIGR